MAIDVEERRTKPFGFQAFYPGPGLDTRESPGFELIELLLHRGAIVNYNDSHIPSLPGVRRFPHLRMRSQPLTPEYWREQDCVLVVTDHSAYDWTEIIAHARLVADTRSATRKVSVHRERIVQA